MGHLLGTELWRNLIKDLKTSTSKDPKEKCKTKIKNLKEILNPVGKYPELWKKIFLLACVIEVVTDPLFLYVPIINDQKKCFGSDKQLKIAALFFRILIDLFFVIDIFYQIQSYRKISKGKVSSLPRRTRKLLPYSILADVLAILPLPQVVMLTIFPKVSGGKSLGNFLVCLHIISWTIRTYLASEELVRIPGALSHWTRIGLYLGLYLSAAHVIGALWYFFSVQRQLACWHEACKYYKIKACVSSTFACNHPVRANSTILNAFCTTDPSKSPSFNFGIFGEAINLGILGPINFGKKLFHCYWWGLRQLSSFGQNLETSSYVLEILFSAVISILGLLLFTYLIGNMQTHMMTTVKKQNLEEISRMEEKELETIFSYGFQEEFHKELEPSLKKQLMEHMQDAKKEQKSTDWENVLARFTQLQDENKLDIEMMCRKLAAFGHSKDILKINADLWMHNNDIRPKWRPVLRELAGWKLDDIQDVDLQIVLSLVPLKYEYVLKRHLCLYTLKKVPVLENMEDKVIRQFINYLKPVVYTENSYIMREGEPLDVVLFITQGIVWTIRSSEGRGTSCSKTTKCLQKGDFYGEELLDWTLKFKSFDDIPISTTTAKCHTKVEALALTAHGSKKLVTAFWWLFSKQHSTKSEFFKPMAASAILKAWRQRQRKNPKHSSRLIEIEVEGRSYMGGNM